MKKAKVLISYCLALSMFLMPAKNILAKDVEIADIDSINISVSIENNSRELSNEEAKQSMGYIYTMMDEEYRGRYTIDSFDAVFYDVPGDENCIDINVGAGLTSILNPNDTDCVKGMRYAISTIKDKEDKKIAEQILEDYIEEQMLYYMRTDIIGYLYRIEIPKNPEERKDINNYKFYSRHDFTSTDIELYPVSVKGYLHNKGSLTVEDGIEKIFDNVAEVKGSPVFFAAKPTYNIGWATGYAAQHGTDGPEYCQGNDSDCANFVSKCLNAGGIPTDKAGEWYGSSSWRSYDCGDNWWRTGKNNNGGVKIYMADTKNYFTKSNRDNASMGGFIYWNSKSHAGLIMRNNNGDIGYAEHSNTKKDSYVYYLKNSDNVQIFNPDSNTLNVTRIRI